MTGQSNIPPRRMIEASGEQWVALDHYKAILAVLREVRGWAEVYEDHMGMEDFARREEAVLRADEVLRND